MRHSIIQNPIVEIIDKALNEKKEYCVIRIPRGQGKSHTITMVIVELLKQNPGWSALCIAGTEKQLREIMEDSGYLAKFGVVSPEWVKTGTGSYRYSNGSVLMFAGAKDNTALSRARGKHPNIVYHDEAQEFTKPRSWMTIFGNMGKEKNCLRIISGTGGRTEDNLLSFIENQIKAKLAEGLVLKKNILEILEEDSGESRVEREADYLKQVKNQTIVREYEGESEVVMRGEDSPYIRREYFLEDTDEEITGGLAFPMFTDRNVIESEYNIDFNKPVYVFSDYGSNDPFGAIFAQIWADEVHIFAEMYRGAMKAKNWLTFASDMSHKLHELRLADIEYLSEESQTGNKIDIERYNVKFIHKDIYFFGDQHGSNWNPQLRFYFKTEFGNVMEAANGIELIQQFSESLQLKIYTSCPNTLRCIKTVTMEENERKRDKFHLPIDHNKSHLITPISYALQYFIVEDHIPVVRKPSEKAKVNTKPEPPKETYYIPFSYGRERRTTIL